jgi:hypothetical protein
LHKDVDAKPDAKNAPAKKRKVEEVVAASRDVTPVSNGKGETNSSTDNVGSGQLILFFLLRWQEAKVGGRFYRDDVTTIRQDDDFVSMIR